MDDAPEEEVGGGASLLPQRIWIKSTDCKIKVSTINISSEEKLLAATRTATFSVLEPLVPPAALRWSSKLSSA